MTKRVILIHGFNVKDGGAKSVDMLKPRLEAEGYEVFEYDYGYLELFMVRFRMDFIAKMLTMIAKPSDRIIAHSNGCAITARAMELGARFNKIVFIHPALNNEWVIPSADSVKSLTVLYSQHDNITRSAKWLRRLSPLGWFGKKSIWGAMGTYGASSKDKRVININDNMGHSEIFKQDNLDDGWEDVIIEAVA